jgi:hypothetical protein
MYMCICIQQNMILRYTYPEMKDLEILDMNFHCAYLRFRVQKIQRLPHWKERGEGLRHHCRAFQLEVFASSYKFLYQLVQVDFIFSLFISEV